MLVDVGGDGVNSKLVVVVVLVVISQPFTPLMKASFGMWHK